MNAISSTNTFSHKPQKCQFCGFSPVATILYGMPNLSDKLQLDIDAGKITLGGCLINNPFNPASADPAWECSKCHNKFFRRIPDELLDNPNH